MKAILFRPQGNLDLKRSYQLQQIVDKLIDKTRNFYCIIDMGFVNKINNFGLTTLVIIRKISEKRGCLLYLFNIQDDIQLVLQLTGLDQKFNVLEDESFLYSLKPKLLLC